jgi:hypothetical protein
MGTGIKDQQYTSPRAAAVTIGDLVRAERRSPPAGTWSRYAGRVGTVVTVNMQRFDNGAPDYVEIGVDLDGDGKASAWFLPSELVAESHRTAATLPCGERKAARAMAVPT